MYACRVRKQEEEERRKKEKARKEAAETAAAGMGQLHCSISFAFHADASASASRHLRRCESMSSFSWCSASALRSDTSRYSQLRMMISTLHQG